MALSKSHKVLIGPSSFCQLDSAAKDKLIAAGITVVDNPVSRKLTKDEMLELLTDDITGLIAGLEPLDREVLASSCLQVVSRCGSGMSNVDIDAARDLNIDVRSTPNGPTNAVAELTMANMLSMLRHIPEMNAALHQGKWQKQIGGLLEEKNVLIVGFGRIGRRLAELLAPFQVNLLVADPFLKEAADNVTLLPLDEAIAIADIITLHASGEDELLGGAEFAKMKEGVFILNPARGTLINEAALLQALDNEKVSGAWIDTFGEEPYAGPLIDYPQVILTPHVGSYARETRQSMEMEAVTNLIEALEKRAE